MTNPEWKDCQRGSPRAAETAGNPQIWRTRLAELNAIFGSTSSQTARTRGVLAEIPAYVLTASETAAAATQVGYDKPKSVWELQHVQLASFSRFGWQRTVYASHRMPTDRPDVVASAVIAMVEGARAGRPPEPLPPSETEQADEPAFPELSR